MLGMQGDANLASAHCLPLLVALCRYEDSGLSLRRYERDPQGKPVVITFATGDRNLFQRLEQLNIEVRKEFEQAGK